MTIREGCPRRNTSRQKAWSDTKSNVSDDSIDEDKYPEGIGQKKAMKYFKEKLLSLH